MKRINWREIERFVGGLKFAVIAISVFALTMIVGTFLESTYGTEFAGRLLYKSPFFIFLQSLLFLSVTMAALLRLPPKKGFYGFYTIHTGLVLLGIGSFITFYAGIDGSITLLPKIPSRIVRLDSDIFTITNPDKGEQIIYPLPYTALGKKLDDQYGSVKLLKYLPFSKKRLKWLPEKNLHYHNSTRSSSRYLIANDNVSQDFTLSLHPEALDFKSSLSMGPLDIHYLPEVMGPCFGKDLASRLFFWNKKESNCFTPEQKKLAISKTSSGKKFVVVKDKKRYLSFFPEISPWPLDKNRRPVKDSSVRVFSTHFFEEKPHLFLFGEGAAFYSDGKWEFHKLKKDEELDLPWMGFQLKLLQHEKKLVPAMIPQYQYPMQIAGKLVQGEGKALQIQVGEETWWVTDEKPLPLLIGNERTYLSIKKRELQLPFEFSLTNFKMQKDPGTENPASYESFVRMFTKEGSSNHHIYMNNPLKHAGFTFYQSSYFQTEGGNYGSVLSANMDPGRVVKYLGSLMLVLGAVWHYRIRRKHVLR